METFIADLKRNYLDALESLEAVVDACPDELWDKPEGNGPFWREAYHGLFWMHNFLGGKAKTLVLHPFGKDIDPRLFAPLNAACGKAEFRQFAEQMRRDADAVVAELTLDELAEADGYEDGEFRTVGFRLLYGLRHVQQHVGKLAAILQANGIDCDGWR